MVFFHKYQDERHACPALKTDSHIIDKARDPREFKLKRIKTAQKQAID